MKKVTFLFADVPDLMTLHSLYCANFYKWNVELIKV